MRTLFFLMVWLLIFVVCWPFAILALAVLPLVWLVSLPLAIIGIGLVALLALIRALLYIPSRMFGHSARV